MIDPSIRLDESIEGRVRQFVFERAARTGVVPQTPAIAEALGLSGEDVSATLKRLAAAKVLILAPNDGDIWAANPFCAVPSGIRVIAEGNRYWAICAWDAMGVVAAVQAETAVITAPCGDCGEILNLQFENHELKHANGIVHFAVPAREWWKNIGFA